MNGAVRNERPVKDGMRLQGWVCGHVWMPYYTHICPVHGQRCDSLWRSPTPAEWVPMKAKA